MRTMVGGGANVGVMRVFGRLWFQVLAGMLLGVLVGRLWPTPAPP